MEARIALPPHRGDSTSCAGFLGKEGVWIRARPPHDAWVEERRGWRSGAGARGGGVARQVEGVAGGVAHRMPSRTGPHSARRARQKGTGMRFANHHSDEIHDPHICPKGNSHRSASCRPVVRADIHPITSSAPAHDSARDSTGARHPYRAQSCPNVGGHRATMTVVATRRGRSENLPPATAVTVSGGLYRASAMILCVWNSSRTSGRTSSACVRRSRNGSSPSSSVSALSSNHETIGMPLSTW